MPSNVLGPSTSFLNNSSILVAFRYNIELALLFVLVYLKDKDSIFLRVYSYLGY